MEHEIRISENCITCAYMTKEAVMLYDEPIAFYRCRLFNKKLSDLTINLSLVKPEKCYECKQLIKNHLETPEFEG
jgi:hypothetical protein